MKIIVFNLDWEIAAYTLPDKCGTCRCNLCLTEKYFVIREDPLILLNIRTELISNCRHKKQVHTKINK